MPSVIIEQKNAAFVDIARTGGTAVARALQVAFPDKARSTKGDEAIKTFAHQHNPEWVKAVTSPGNYPASILRDFVGADRWDSWLTFAIVRNPWDRAYSTYEFIKGAPKHRRHEAAKTKTFEQFLETVIADREINQVDWIADGDKLLVSHVLKFETLAEDIKPIAEQLGLPAKKVKLANAIPSNYKQAYSNASRQLIADKFARDISSFGYEFD